MDLEKSNCQVKHFFTILICFSGRLIVDKNASFKLLSATSFILLLKHYLNFYNKFVIPLENFLDKNF